MRRRSLIALTLGVVLALLGVGLVARRKRSPTVLVVRTLTQHTAAQWWNPLTWGSSIGHIASSAVGDVENWARHAISAAITVVQDAVDAIIDGIDLVITEIEGTLSWFTIAFHLLTDFSHWVWNTAIPFVSHILTTDIENWARDAIGAVETTFKWVVTGISDALGALTAAYHWVLNNVIDPVFTFVQHATTWLVRGFDWLWTEVYNKIIAPVFADVAWLWDNVPVWITWLWHTAWGAVEAVIKAITWIIWFGEHTFDDLRTLVTGTEGGINGSVIYQAAKGTLEWLLSLEDELARWLGV